MDLKDLKNKLKEKKELYYGLIAIGWILLMYSVFIFGAVYTCEKSDGFLMDDLECIELNRSNICSYEGRIYSTTMTTIDFNMDLG